VASRAVRPLDALDALDPFGALRALGALDTLHALRPLGALHARNALVAGIAASVSARSVALGTAFVLHDAAAVTELDAPGLGRFLVEGYVSDVQPQALRVGAMGFGVTPELRAQLAPGQLVRLSGRSEGGNRIVERADFLSGPFDVRPQRSLRMEPLGPRSGDDRRGGGEGDRSGRDSGDRSGRGGGDRTERVDRSGRR